MQVELPQRRRRQLISLTPLIDVVFILLVFFMLASSFLDWRMIPLSTPAQTRAQSTVQPLVIRIDAGRQLSVEGDVLALRELDVRIRRVLAGDPQRPVRVQPESTVPVQTVVTVLDRLAEAGVTDVGVIRE